MKYIPTVFKLTAILLLLGMNHLAAQMANYPTARKHHEVEEYHHIQVKDAYQWMEDLNAPELHSWMSAQEDYLQQFLDESSFELIKNGMDRFGQTGKGYSVPQRGGDFYYYTVNGPALPHSLLYRKKGLEGEPEMVLDMNKELEEGQTFGGYSLSPGAKTLICWMRNGQNSYGQLNVFDLQKNRWQETIDGRHLGKCRMDKQGGLLLQLFRECRAAEQQGNSSASGGEISPSWQQSTS